MDDAEFKLKVLALAERAEASLTVFPDFPSVEPIYEELLRLVEEEPQHRAALCEVLIDLVAPLELVEFVAHVLRWPELKQAFERRLAAAEDPRTRRALERCLAAFSDDWDLREVYRRWD